MRIYKLTFCAIWVLASFTLPLKAQYQGDQFLGFAGLQAGTQPSQGYYLTLPLFYDFNNISIYGPQGNQVAKDVTAGINLFVVPSFQVVTPFKILGANYGASFTQWILNGRVDVAALNFKRSTPYAYGDIYVQPAVLGWHLKRADITAGYAFFAPSNTGASLRMWVNEIDFGTTLYADKARKWNVSTMMYYDFNGRKNNADIKPGQIMTLGGGLGRSFLQGAANVGVAYGAQWKMTHDSGSGIPPLLPIANGRVFGVGPEIDMPVFAKGKNVGLISARYLWPSGPKEALGGQILAISFTLAHFPKPVK
ncbi:MAG TPA: transporter [Terriglobia bacterium]